MPIPPEQVRRNAQKGLDLRRKFGRGGTQIGVARARDLAGGRNVSDKTIRRMVSFFARHEVDKKAPGFGSDSDPSAGYIAWLLWGGDAGRRWARGQAAEMGEDEMRTGLVLQMEGLPPHPKDAGGRLVKWVLLAQSPGFVYGDRKFTVDDDFINRQLSDFATLTRGGYRPPLLREHTRNGERSGDVLALSSMTLDGRPALIGAVAFSDPEAGDKIKRGEVKYVSPAFGPLQDDEGREYDFVLREVSLVAAPHQKNLSSGSSHVLGSEQGENPMSTENQPVEEVSPPVVEAEEQDASSMEDRLSNLEKSVAHVLDMLTKMMMEGDKDKDEDEEVEADETAQLRERINALEEERDRAVWSQTQPEALKWTPALGELLFGAWRADRETVSATLGEATIERSAPPAKVEEAPAVNPFAVRMSEPSGQPVERSTSDEDLSAEALRIADGDQTKALQIYRRLKTQTLN